MMKGFVLLALLTACGQSQPQPVYQPVVPQPAPSPVVPVPSPGPSPTPTPESLAWSKIAPIVQKDCGACHNGTIQPAFLTGAAFKSSDAKNLILSGQMPPATAAALSADDKTALLAYLNG